ncbi:hypothetical protein [Methanothermococcus okinawensis]|uniref:Condensin complex subunit 1 C-terminal domain-containing protein n=1 Tax=Methanothermococcus okinawensis (strain DSM 14208 / JCM 11175 / IH1) TaxID=647113 RepID=F8AKJ3_METOI|nr:hypothetical protein [Methanothermococcus okinawensis]AEH07525.1 hypothetical protein Metok_1562 [Methanothermococcus okinawensis IH1]
MYEKMMQEELSKLFKEYCELDWKKKSEAARILSYINNANEIKKLEEQIIKLAQDNNLVTRINLMNSIKKLVLDHHIINEDIFVLLYFWANSPNTTTSEFAKQIINSLNVNTIVRYIHSLSLKLYSSNPYEVTYAMVSLGLISTITPEHLTNTLPEIVLVSNGYGYKILQVLAIEILEEFKTLDKYLFNKVIFSIYDLYNNNQVKYDDFDITHINKKSDLLEYVLYIYFKKNISKKDILNLMTMLNCVNTNNRISNNSIVNLITMLNIDDDVFIKSMIMATLHIHSDVLCQILEENKELSNQLMDKIIASFDNPSWMVKLSSMFLFKRLILFDKLHIKDEYLDMFFNRILKNFNDKYVIKGFSLEILYYLFKNTESEYIKRKVFEIVDKIDLKSIMNEGHLCYYNGLYLAYELKRYECFSATCSPNFDITLIGEFNTLSIAEYHDVIKSINASVKQKYWLSGWLNRYYAGKYLGNLIYTRPGHASNILDIIYTLLDDNNYITRCMGIWILRLTTELGIEPPMDVIIKSISLLDDWYYECRIEYMLFYNTLLKSFPHLLENQSLKKRLISAITSRYLTDKNEFVKDICIMLLNNKRLSCNYPEFESFKNYYHLSIPERIELLKKCWKVPELRKAVIIIIKTRLKYYIKKRDYITIEIALKKIFDGDENTYEEISYILYELIQIKEKSNIVKKIVDTFKNKYPKLPKNLEKQLFHNINDSIISIRTYKLKRLLAFVREGIIISYELLNKIKEIVIYECVSEKNLNIASSILEEINDFESRRIIKEKKELMEYMENSLYFKTSIRDLELEKADWKEYCIKITYIPTIGILDIFTEDNLNNAVKTLIPLLNIEDLVILKIKIIDLLTEEISKNEELLNALLDNDEILPILLKLYVNKRYNFISKKALMLLEELSLRRDNWLKNSLIDYFKDYAGSQNSLNNILYILTENISARVKIEILNFLGYASKNKLIVCNKDMAYTFVDIILNIDNNQPWAVFKNAVDIIFSCQYIQTDKKLLDDLIKKFTDYMDIMEEEEKKDYLIIYLKKLLEMGGPNIVELNEEVIEKLLEFENKNL